MRKSLSGLDYRMELGHRSSVAVLILTLLAAGLCSVLHAIAKPFWYDEVCTVILCRLPNASEIWNALSHAADTNPPPFYLLTRAARQLVPDDHLGYRLPAILGLLGTVSCVYFILSRRARRLSALVGAAFVLCTPLAEYAYEARPYSLMVACVSCAILFWQRIEDSRLYAIAAGASLAGALCLHYYAVLVWPAFIVAEASVWIVRRRFRISAWAAIIAGAFPLFLFAPLLLKVRLYYGQNFWAKPSMKGALFSYFSLFITGGHWGVIFAVGIFAILLYVGLTKTAGSDGSGYRAVKVEAIPIEERALILMLLCLPLIAFAAARIGHGGMAWRYMLPTVLGGALALGYGIDKVSSARRLFLLVFLLMVYALSSGEFFVREHAKGSLLESRARATGEVKTIAAGSDLPIVIASGSRYLPMAYYASADSSGKLFAIADPREAVIAIKSDSVDLSLLALRQYFPLQVEDYAGFLSRHREFLVVSGDGFEWLTGRLERDGYALKLVSSDGESTVYKVTVRP